MDSEKETGTHSQVKITSYSVDNPLAQVTRVSVVFPFGSVTDPTQKQGISSMAVDLMLKGAREFNSRQISERFALYGATVEFVVGQFYSILQINVLSQYLKECLEFLRVLMKTPTFPQNEFKLLKVQYISNIKSTVESNKSLLWRAYKRWYYGAEPLSHVGGGTLESMNALSNADIKTWWKTSFGASAVRVFVSSDRPKSQVVPLIESSLSWIRPVKNTDVNYAKAIKYPTGIEVLIVDKPDTTTNDFMFAHPSMSFAADKNDYYANYLANTAFGSGMQSRLFQELRDKRGWTYHASSNYWGAFYHDVTVPWVVYTFPSLKYTDEAVPLAYEMMKTYMAKGLSPEEIKLYKTSMIRAYPFTVDTPNKVLDKKFDEVVQGRYVLDEKQREAIIEAVSNEKILASLRKVHDVNKMVFLIVGDAPKIKAQLPKWFKTIASTRVVKPEEIL